MAEGVRTITETPAVMLGIERHKGMLKPGADADLVVLDDREEGGKIMFSIGEVWKFGVRVFDGGIEAKI